MPRPYISPDRPYTPQSGHFAGTTFFTEHEYKEAHALRQGYVSRYQREATPQRFSSVAKLKGISPLEELERDKAIYAVDINMRERGMSLSQAAKYTGTTPRQVKRYAGDALVREHGRYKAKQFDHMLRKVTVLYTDNEGEPKSEELYVTDSRTAAILRQHAKAINKYFGTGDPADLQKLRGKSVVIRGRKYPLLTDLDEINGIGDSDMLPPEDTAGT